jgi:hypothetical protein
VLLLMIGKPIAERACFHNILLPKQADLRESPLDRSEPAIAPDPPFHFQAPQIATKKPL